MQCANEEKRNPSLDALLNDDEIACLCAQVLQQEAEFDIVRDLFRPIGDTK